MKNQDETFKIYDGLDTEESQKEYEKEKSVKSNNKHLFMLVVFFVGLMVGYMIKNIQDE